MKAINNKCGSECPLSTAPKYIRGVPNTSYNTPSHFSHDFQFCSKSESTKLAECSLLGVGSVGRKNARKESLRGLGSPHISCLLITFQFFVV